MTQHVHSVCKAHLSNDICEQKESHKQRDDGEKKYFTTAVNFSNNQQLLHTPYSESITKLTVRRESFCLRFIIRVTNYI
jgi:hypothetical protein